MSDDKTTKPRNIDKQLFESFKKYAVKADSVEDFVKRFHKPEILKEYGEDFMEEHIANHQMELDKHGYTFIPQGTSTTGDHASFYGEGVP